MNEYTELTRFVNRAKHNIAVLCNHMRCCPNCFDAVADDAERVRRAFFHVYGGQALTSIDIHRILYYKLPPFGENDEETEIVKAARV